jgi:hypothetical protein
MSRLSLLLLLGCGPITVGNDSGDTAADTDTDTDADSDADTDTDVSPDAPVIESVDTVTCAPNTDSEPTWIVEATATDPQGLDTFAKLDNYAQVIIDGVAGEEHYGVCNKGQLTVSWEDPSGVEACEITGTIRVVAVDEDGHASAPWDYDWPAQ